MAVSLATSASSSSEGASLLPKLDRHERTSVSFLHHHQHRRQQAAGERQQLLSPTAAAAAGCGSQRRQSLLDVSTELIRSLPNRQQYKPLSSSSSPSPNAIWWNKRWHSQGDDKEKQPVYSYQSTMTIHEVADEESCFTEERGARRLDTDASVAFPTAAAASAAAAFVLVEQPRHLPPTSTAAQRHASYVLNRTNSSDQRQASAVLSVRAGAESRVGAIRNVYVYGQKKMTMGGGGKQAATKPIGNIKRRSQLSLQRARLTDFAAVLAMSGLLLAIIDAELLARGVIEEGHYASIILRSIVIFLTLLLLILIAWYHAVEVKILLLDNSTRDICVVLTIPRMAQCFLELCICCVCPIPANLMASYARLINDNDTEIVQVPLSGILTTAMFLRLYLLCRLTAFHSRQFQDAGTRTVAAMSRISINFSFVMKTVMVEYPLTVLLVTWIGFAVSIAWLFAQCERQGNPPDQTPPGYLNSMWFMMATLMANGYGDTIPQTYCGRALAIITSLGGIGITASLVAVVRQKLQLTQFERRVNEFVTDSRLASEKKNAAAAVLQQTWFIHKCMRAERSDYGKLRKHQRRFLTAINEFRRIKFDQRMLFDSSYDLSEITHIQKGLKQLMCDLQSRHVHTARLAYFAGQQLEQLRKTVEQWQASRSMSRLDSPQSESFDDQPTESILVSTTDPSTTEASPFSSSTIHPPIAAEVFSKPTPPKVRFKPTSKSISLNHGDPMPNVPLSPTVLTSVGIPLINHGSDTNQSRSNQIIRTELVQSIGRDRLDSDKIDSHVITGEVADIAEDAASSVINEQTYHEGW